MTSEPSAGSAPTDANPKRARRRWLIAGFLVLCVGLSGVWVWNLERFSDARDCEAHDDRACLRMGARYDYGVGLDKDPAQARAYYESALAFRIYPEVSAGAAEALATLLERGAGGPIDSARALALYAEACRSQRELRVIATACIAEERMHGRVAPLSTVVPP